MDSTTPLVEMPPSTSAFAPAPRSSTSRSLPLNALTRRLTMTGSSGRGESAACTWVAGWSCVIASPDALSRPKLRLVATASG